MIETPSKINVPRKLKGRVARNYWRRLAPQVTRDGTLSPISEQLLLILCRELGRMAAKPTGGSLYDTGEILKLTKQLGLRP